MGKFGQRSILDSYEFVKTYASFIKKLCDNKLNVKTWDIIHEDYIEMRFCEDSDQSIEADYMSEITAVFTTSNARMRSYDFLPWLHPSQLIYCDTDSCYFLFETNPLHKKADNNNPTLQLVLNLVRELDAGATSSKGLMQQKWYALELNLMP